MIGFILGVVFFAFIVLIAWVLSPPGSGIETLIKSLKK